MKTCSVFKMLIGKLRKSNAYKSVENSVTKAQRAEVRRESLKTAGHEVGGSQRVLAGCTVH